MGKKPKWFSAITSLCTSNSKHQLKEDDKKTYSKRRGRFKRGSSIPFRREPSSIEDILGEVDQHNLFIQHHPVTQSQQQPQSQPQSPPQPPPQPQPQPNSQQSQPPPQPQQQQQQPQSNSQQSQPQPTSSSSGRPVSPPPQRFTSPPRVEPKTSRINEPTLQQRHLSAIRIQAVYRGYMARRKVGSLTGLARLQRLVTSQNVKRQTVNAMKQMQLLVRVQTQIQSQRIQTLKNQALKPQPKSNKHHKEADEEDWDDSLITKEEREARLKRKEEALIKRERAMAYAYSHQSLKGTPTTSAHLIGGYPWWWKWLEHQLPYHASPILKKHQYATTPSRSRPRTPTTPMSSKSTNPYSKARKGASPSPYPMTDNDSLMSCPPFSVPNYMSPTASARAKARPTSNPKERCLTPTTPRSETSNRRFSYPLNNRHKSPGSIGDLSMDSMPASVGRKPFNRFV